MSNIYSHYILDLFWRCGIVLFLFYLWCNSYFGLSWLGLLEYLRPRIIVLSNLLSMSVPNAGFSGKVSCALKQMFLRCYSNCFNVRFVVLNATFNNISVISWWSVLLVNETGEPRENHRSFTDKLYHIMYYNIIAPESDYCFISMSYDSRVYYVISNK